ncbi:sugar transferase [Edaphobacter sp. HDX4]|uniref:sugar transferase n=1 Tax=Edaphobacter sp. HDX4 TaxID=2794064 RepID=UPI002FE654BF
MCDSAISLSKADTASSWCASQRRRCIDVAAATFGLVVLSPLIVVICAAILVSSGSPIFFVQRRAGRDGVEFPLLKFRTMKVSVRRGSGLTREGDSRVTAIGRLLRKSKLDELPQLVNVLKGEMSLVGPRPDLREFWNQAAPEHRRVLNLTPGITGAASLAFSREEKLLAQVPAEDLTTFYLEELLPAKARLDIEYAAQATFLSDCRILLRTVSLPLIRWWQTAENANEMETDEQISR